MADEVDKIYTVITTATLREAIQEQVRYIAVDQQSPQNTGEWLDRVWTHIDGLEFLPQRNVKADGYDHLPLTVRRIILDNHLILYTVDENSATVYIVGIRHGASLPRPCDLQVDPRPTGNPGREPTANT